jgi:hypothetical protein
LLRGGLRGGRRGRRRGRAGGVAGLAVAWLTLGLERVIKRIPLKTILGSTLGLFVGLGIGKLVKIGPLPVKFTVEVDYMAIHPDDFGQHWGVRFQIIPVLPALFKDTLF